ncbi:MFS transporter [Novosphingobium terrae]|uniref:MFS transporter n=1 Tax=Novosphingobium terrae TaxID=2726189 RepID=UPI001F13A18C|nr:MFS transporter [Novosphingobium terrae]
MDSPLPDTPIAQVDTRGVPVGLVHLALAMGGFAIGTTEFATMSLLPPMAAGLGVDAPTAGHVISAYALGVVIGAPLLAVLGAKLARRTLLILLMAAFCLFNALSAIAPDYHWMLAFRFLSGLPHGAYFGVAALVAASLVPTGKRAQAVGRIMLGLTIATTIGVPVASWLGQVMSWRWGFGVVAILALLCAAMVAIFVPHDKPDADINPLRELDALRNGQVWLTLAVGAIGFGGMFCVYTYLASALENVTHASPATISLIFAIFGVGMTLGNMFVPRFADRALMPTAAALLVWSALWLALYPLAVHSLWAMVVVIFAIGCGGAMGSILQTRLMDVAGEAQSLAAALNHSAFNTANALGPWLGGLAIAGGYGWASTGLVGAALAIGGLLILILAMRLEARDASSDATACEAC